MSSQPGIPTIHFSRILIELGRYIQGINLNRIIDGLEAEKILNSQFAQKLKDVNDEYEKSNIVINIMQGRQENDFKTFLNIVAAEKPDGKFYDTTKQFFSGFTMFPGYEQYATWPNDYGEDYGSSTSVAAEKTQTEPVRSHRQIEDQDDMQDARVVHRAEYVNVQDKNNEVQAGDVEGKEKDDEMQAEDVEGKEKDDEMQAGDVEGKEKDDEMQAGETIPPTEIKVFLVPVGDSAKVECDGKYGGSYLWEGHGFTLILPPDCADGTVTVNLRAYLPCSTLKHGFVSAVFDITTNIKKFKKPITIRFPHCVNIRSKRNTENLQFIILHNNSYKFRNGYFEIGERYGSIELTNFCKLGIHEMIKSIYNYTVSSFSRVFTSGLSQSQNATVLPSNMEDGCSNVTSDEAESNNRKYLELLILPKSHNEDSNWNGTYCIVQDIDTFMQIIIKYFKEKTWIDPSNSQKVFTRKVTFSETTNDAIAKICLVDKSPGDIHLINYEIPKKKIDILLLQNDDFPKCILVITGKLSSSSSRLKVNGVCVEGNSSTEFNLSFPTKFGYEQKVYDQNDPHIVKKKFDCKAAAEHLRERFDELSNLPYKAMENALYSKKVITRQDKEIIKAKITNTDKMEYLIDILIVSLHHSFPDKYRGFLIAMETNEDTLLQQKARDLGGSAAVDS